MIVLNGITWDHDRGYLPLLQTTESFEKDHPDIKIQWKKRTLKEFGDCPIEKLATEYDLLLIDHPFSGEAYKNHLLVDYREYLSSDAIREREEQEIGRTSRCYNYNGKQLALSVDIAAMVSAARDDLMEQYGCRMPRNLEEILGLGRESGKVAVPLGCTDIWCIFLSLGAARKGADFITESDIDRETAEWAIEQLHRIKDTVIPGCLEMNPVQIMDRMSETNEIIYTSFCFGYVNYSWRGRKNPLTFYNIPLWEGAKTASVLGGVGIAVSAGSSHIQEAVQYAEYVTRPDVQKNEYFLAGGQPGQKDAWRSSRNNELTGNFFNNTMETIEHAYLRPRFPGWNVFQEKGGYLLNQSVREGRPSRETADKLISLFHASFTK